MHFSHDDLGRHFPGKVEHIRALRLKDQDFRHLCDSYADLERAIHRRATDAVFTDRRQAEALRRHREILQQAIAASLA